MIWKSKCATKTNSAGKIKREGAKISLVENWDELRVYHMEECLRQKYSQEPYKTKLLNTHKYIQEGNTWGDEFWGVNLETGEGLNILGELIMEIREELRDEN